VFQVTFPVKFVNYMTVFSEDPSSLKVFMYTTCTVLLRSKQTKIRIDDALTRQGLNACTHFPALDSVQ